MLTLAIQFKTAFPNLRMLKIVTNHNHSQDVYLGPYQNLWRSFFTKKIIYSIVRSNPPKVFLGKGIPKTSSKFTEKYPCWSAISINLLYTLTRVFSWNLLHVFRPPFCKNTYERLLLSLRFLTGSYIHLCLHNILTLLKKYLSVFSPNTGKYGPKQLRIRALFKQRNSFEISQISLEIAANK